MMDAVTIVHEPGADGGDVDGSPDRLAADDLVPAAGTPHAPAARRRRFARRRPIEWKLVAASLAIALGVALIGFGISRSVTGDEVTKLPEQIESISPVPDAVQVPAQANVVVDLIDGYAGEMTIDNVTYETWRPRAVVDRGEDVVPGGQVDIRDGVVYDPNNFTLTFTPGEDVGFEEWPVGNHHVRVRFWEERDGEIVDGTLRQYNWTFNIV